MSIKRNGNIFDKYDIKWVISISISTFILAIFFSIITENSIDNLNTFLSFLLLFIIIVIGVMFDILGIALLQRQKKNHFILCQPKKLVRGMLL